MQTTEIDDLAVCQSVCLPACRAGMMCETAERINVRFVAETLLGTREKLHWIGFATHHGGGREFDAAFARLLRSPV